MSRSFKDEDAWWEAQNGKAVIIDGVKYQLHVSVIDAIYPVHERRLFVYADPVNKQAKHYQEIRKQLGDDWSTDVLESPEFECTVRAQLHAA